MIRGFLQVPSENEGILTIGLSDKSFSGIAVIDDDFSLVPKPFEFTRIIWHHISCHPEMRRESSEVVIRRIKTRLEEALRELNINVSLAKTLLCKMHIDKPVEPEELFECCKKLLVRQNASKGNDKQEDGIRYVLPEELKIKFREFDRLEEERIREAERIATEKKRSEERQKAALQRQDTEKRVGDKKTGEECDKTQINQRVERVSGIILKQQIMVRCAKREIKEVVRKPNDWERMPYPGSRIILPKVSNEEISLFAKDIRMLEQIPSEFAEQINNPSQNEGYDWVAMEYVETEEKEVVIVYDAVTDCCYKYDLTDKQTADILREMLEGANCMVICYMPFILVPKLRRAGILLKKLCPIYSLSEVIMPGHVISMWQLLRGYGAKDWHQVWDYEKEHDVSTVMRYLSSYGQVWDCMSEKIKEMDKANEAKYQMFCDVTLANFFDTESGKPYLLRSAGNYWHSNKLDLQPGMKAWQLRLKRTDGGMADYCILFNVMRALINSVKLRGTSWSIRRMESNGFVLLLPMVYEEKTLKGIIGDVFEAESQLLKDVVFQVKPIPYDAIRGETTENISREKPLENENRFRGVLGAAVSLFRKNKDS